MMRSTHSMSVRLTHAHARELAHERGPADHLREQPRHLEVEAVLGVEELGVLLQREPVAGRQRLVQHLRRDAGRSRTRSRCPRR